MLCTQSLSNNQGSTRTYGSSVSKCLWSWGFSLCWSICCQHPMQIAIRFWERSESQPISWWPIFHDGATCLIWAENQVSLGAGESLMAKDALNNGYRIRLLLKIITLIETMEFSILTYLMRIARTSASINHFLELVIIIRMPLLSSQFNHDVHGLEIHGSCIFTLKWVWSWKSFTLEFNAAWLHNYISNILSGLPLMELLTKALLSSHLASMFRDAQSMSYIQNFKMVKRFLSEIFDHIWVNFWD